MGPYAPDCVARKLRVGEGFQDYALKLGDGTTALVFCRTANFRATGLFM